MGSWYLFILGEKEGRTAFLACTYMLVELNMLNAIDSYCMLSKYSPGVKVLIWDYGSMKEWAEWHTLMYETRRVFV